MISESTVQSETILQQIENFYNLLSHPDTTTALNQFKHYFPSPCDLKDMSYDEIQDFISHYPNYNRALLVGIEIGKCVAKASRPKLLNARHSVEMGEFCQQQLGNLKQEQLCLAALDAQLNIINWEVVFVGTLTHVQASPREIFQRLLRTNAYGFMIVHNHPSGNLKPSKADIQFSQKLVTLGQQMDIHMFDSFIVSCDGYWSMSENQQLKIADVIPTH